MIWVERGVARILTVLVIAMLAGCVRLGPGAEVRDEALLLNKATVVLQQSELIQALLAASGADDTTDYLILTDRESPMLHLFDIALCATRTRLSYTECFGLSGVALPPEVYDWAEQLQSIEAELEDPSNALQDRHDQRMRALRRISTVDIVDKWSRSAFRDTALTIQFGRIYEPRPKDASLLPCPRYVTGEIAYRLLLVIG